MSMTINTNVSALNTLNQLNKNSEATSSSLEKLSSGLQINSAADDAAGLAISEKMRAQINGLDQASTNAQDGISMIQTAEGALSETEDILQRMRELSVQSSNDTNTEDDRAEIQKEIDQLSEEISRIGDTTEFNTQSLLDGTLEDVTFQIGANENQSMSISVNDMQGYALGVAGDIGVEVSADVTDGGNSTTDIEDGSYTVSDDGSGTYELTNSDGDVVATSTDGLAFTASTGDDTLTFTEAAVTDGSVEISGGTATATASFDNIGLEAGNYTLEYSAGASSIVDDNGDVIATSTDDTTFTNSDGDTVLTLDAAASDDMKISVGGIDVSSADAATSAITTIDEAIKSVSAERSKLGAYQNRLDHTINNLETSSENLTSAESRIRDTDMAAEMTEYSKNNVLTQAATSMLAQANSQSQNVLSILQS